MRWRVFGCRVFGQNVEPQRRRDTEILLLGRLTSRPYDVRLFLRFLVLGSRFSGSAVLHATVAWRIHAPNNSRSEQHRYHWDRGDNQHPFRYSHN
jgi:hypothetical protein